MVTLDFCFKTFNLSLKRHRTSSAALVVWSRFKKGLKHHNLKLLVILLLLTFLVDNQDDDNNDDILRAKNWWSLIKIIGRSRAGVELAVTKGGQSFTSLGRGFEYPVIYITALVVWCSAALVVGPFRWIISSATADGRDKEKILSGKNMFLSVGVCRS